MNYSAQAADTPRIKAPAYQIATATVALAVSFGGMLLTAPQAEAQSACSSYTITRGDTLHEIAVAAEVRGGYKRLFAANRDVLASPNSLEVGQVLQIPCADGSLPDSASASAAPVTIEAVATPDTVDAPVRFLTASGYAPFTDEALPDGGLFTQMVRRSMELGNADQEFEIVFVNDWGAHLTQLLPFGAFDMGFPWYRPDCDRVELLSPGTAIRCTEFNHSMPFYEAEVGYYTLKGSAYAGATDYKALYGSRICRPDGWFVFDMEAEGLVEPNISLTMAANEEACWALLQNGEVDVITYDALPAVEDASELGITDQVHTMEALTSKQTLHVFVPKNNPNGDAYLEILNAGFEQLRLSGEWFEIVRRSVEETVMN